MDGLDIVVILGSGVKASKFYNSFFDEQFKKRSTRLIYFIPHTWDHNIKEKYYRYAVKDSMSWWFENQDSVAPEYVNWYKYEIPVFIWKSTDLESFVENPSIRFLDDPKPKNYILLVDNRIESGLTKTSSFEDITRLGYDKNKIFLYTDIIRKNKRFQDYEGNTLSKREFEKRICG